MNNIKTTLLILSSMIFITALGFILNTWLNDKYDQGYYEGRIYQNKCNSAYQKAVDSEDTVGIMVLTELCKVKWRQS